MTLACSLLFVGAYLAASVAIGSAVGRLMRGPDRVRGGEHGQRIRTTEARDHAA